MKLLLFLSFCLVATTMAATHEQLQNIAILPLLHDEPRWREIVNCLLDRGPCGKYQVLKDSVYQIHGDCNFCHTKEKDVVMQGQKALSDRYPRDIDQIHRKYSKLVKRTV